VRILVVGTGGVGSAFARIAKRRSFFDHCALADYDTSRPADVLGGLDDGRFSAHAIDASSKESIVQLIRETAADAVLNAVDPLFNVPIFDACFEAGVTYLDMAMTLSEPHPTNPFEEVGVKLGDYQFERAEAWEERGLLALVGIGVEPASQTDEAMPVLRELFPGAAAYDSALEAGLSALNPVVHPPGVLMNAGRIERSTHAISRQRHAGVVLPDAP